MASSEFKRLKARADELIGNRDTTQNTWQEIADNCLGRRDFTTTNTPGRQRMHQIYDDTFKVSSSLLAGALHALLTSPVAKWFDMRFEEPALNDDAEAKLWLDLVVKRLYSAIAAPSANFHAQLSECYTDLINFGTGAIFVDDVPGKGIQFSARPLQELYLAEDPSGRIDTIVREFRLTARQAVALWGDRAKRATKAVGGGKSEDTQIYLHIILPNDDIAIGKSDASGMPWASFFLSDEDSEIMDQGGYHELPIATPRWEKDAGEIYGRGPGWNALSNQKMLNAMKKVTLSAAQKAVDPPMMVDSSGVFPGDLNFNPAAIIPIDSVMSMMNPPIQALPFGGNFSITESMIVDARKAVQDSFHHQLIETIRDPRMTATQVLELSAQMQRHLAPILGRLSTELLEPVLERIYAIEARAGRLPVPPAHIGDQPLKIDYVSPVARAQQTSDARAIIDFSGIAASLIEADPEVAFVVDFKDAARQLADALGVPASMIRDSKQVAQMVAASAEAAAQQQAQEQAVMATDQIAKLATAMPNQQGVAA